VLGISFNVIGSSAADSLSINQIKVNDQIVWEDLENDTVVTYFGILGDRLLEKTRIELLSKGETKIIDLAYKVKVQFVSEDCGPRYIFSDLTVSEHNFDSLNLVNSTPGRDGSTLNVRIYRCPQLDTIGLSFFQLALPETGAASSRPISAELSSITVDGAAQLYVDRTVSSIKLPVNLLASKTNYTFSFADAFGFDQPVRDLTVGYRVTPRVRYNACGEQLFVDSLVISPIPAGIPFDQISIATENDGDLRNVVTDPETTNVNIYRCPPTNIIQIAFENAAGLARSKEIISVTNDYDSQVLYENVTASRIQLPLNPATNSTTFTVQLEDATETISLNYSWTDPRISLFPAGSSCLQRKVITDLSESVDNPNVALEAGNVLYPAITNLTLEVAD
jgi:hypothetical protein